MNIPVRPKRSFLPEKLEINSWEVLLPFFENLSERELKNVKELHQWLTDRSELDAVLEEDMAWRYIKMNIDTTDSKLSESFNFFVSEISPKVAPYDDTFNKKLISSPFLAELDQKKYFIFLRGIKNSIEIFREKNIPLNTELQTESQKFGSISAAMQVTIEDKELTMQQAAKLLKDNNRQKREEVYHKMAKRRLQDKSALNNLYDKLIGLRTKVAKNADFDNYRDYMFKAMGRFDYSVKDCENFHQAIAQEIVPITNHFDRERKIIMKLDQLKPWDTSVDPLGLEPLKPFETASELVNKTVECFNRLDPYFGECIAIMNKMGHLDLESKKGKAPGGFNYPLYEIGVPFIYMNSVGTVRDLVTMVHEGGHAIHSFLSKDLELTDFKSCPSEVAELASMSMELLSMEHWDIFFKNKADLKRARKEQLQQVLETLPWVATIDKFQHWVYTKPRHKNEERYAYWQELMKEFGSNVIDWGGNEDSFKNLWQKQLHLFEVPFYYIEYGMAQLGAIAVWRNYKKNGQKAIDQYKEALSLGYTKSIGEIYETAGIKFDFSPVYVKELASFIQTELEKVS